MHRLRDWIRKQDLTFCCLQETHLNHKDRHLLRVKCWEKVFQAIGPKKQAGVALLISIKIDIKLKSIRSDGDGHLILITGTIHQEEVSILNIYAAIMEAPTYVKETFLELKAIKPHTLIVGDFNILHLPMDRSFRDKPNSEIRELIQETHQST